MFWIKKSDWHFEIKIRKTLFLKKNTFFIQYHFYILKKKNLKNLKKFYSKVYAIVGINFFHNWQVVNIFKKRKFSYLCMCIIEEFFFNKKVLFYNKNLYSRKSIEKRMLSIQFYNIIPIYCRIVLSITFFWNSKLNITLRNFFGLHLKTFSYIFKLKKCFIRKKNKKFNNCLFKKLKKLSIIGVNSIDEKLLFFSFCKNYLIFLQNQKKLNSSFSIFLNTLIYNININI